MKDSRNPIIFLMIFVLTVLFIVSTAAFAIQLQPQKQQMIKIPNPQSFKQKYTVAEFTYPNFSSWMTQNSTVMQQYEQGKVKFDEVFKEYHNTLATCANKSYTYQEQQNAGCSQSDSIEQCADKLLRSCIWQQAQKLKMETNTFIGKVQAVNDSFETLLSKLNILKNELNKMTAQQLTPPSSLSIAPPTQTQQPQIQPKRQRGQTLQIGATQSMVIAKPRIDSVFTVPLGALKPGTKLYLNGSFGIQPEKILMCGNFPGNCVELEQIKWESKSKVNGVVPLLMKGQPNQSVEIKVLAKAPPANNYSNTKIVGFIGSPYCGQDQYHHIIYNIDGTVGRDCTPYACREDPVGVNCHTSCTSTADCAKNHICNSKGQCVFYQN